MISEPGKGSCFTIDVPVSISGPVIEADHPRQDAFAATKTVVASTPTAFADKEITRGLPAVPSATGRRILLIDDDRSLLDIAERLLNKEGFSPVSTDSPASAAHLARLIVPDIILLDILMPEVDGWSVLKALKRDPATAAIPVVMLSIVDDRKRAIESGALGIVTKPLQRAELLRTLKSVCEVATTNKLRINEMTQSAVA